MRSLFFIIRSRHLHHNYDDDDYDDRFDDDDENKQVASVKESLERKQRRLTALLARFRIIVIVANIGIFVIIGIIISLLGIITITSIVNIQDYFVQEGEENSSTKPGLESKLLMKTVSMVALRGLRALIDCFKIQ